MISALESLKRLRDGNARFAANVRGIESFLTQERRAQLAEGQAPHAVVLGCSDSRVPVEIVFDQGLGDLFVIRVAGNIVAPSLVGSVEYAAEVFGKRQHLIIVARVVAQQRPDADRPIGLHGQDNEPSRNEPQIDRLSTSESRTTLCSCVHSPSSRPVIALAAPARLR